MKHLKFLFSLICVGVIHPVLAQLPMVNETAGPVPPQETDRKKTPVVFSKDGLYGLKKNETVLLPPVYQEIIAVTGKVLQLKQRNKYGVSDINGSIFIPVEYDSIKNNFIGNRAIVVYKNGKAGVLNTRGEEILPLQYNAILYSNADSRYALVKKEGKEVLLFGKEPLRVNYQSLIFYNNLAVIKQDNQYALLKNDGLETSALYDSIYVAQQKSYLSPTGNALYTDYRTAANTLFIMQKNKYGLLNSDGTVIADPAYDNIQYDHYRKVFHIKKDTLTGLYLEATKMKTAVEYEQVYSDGMKFITVKKNRRYGIINYRLEQVLPCEFDKIDIMGATGSFRVTQNSKAGLFTENGKEIIPVLYDSIGDFSLAQKLRGLYKVSLNNRYGIVNSDGKTIVPVVFTNVFEKNNFLVVTNGNKYGLYNRDGKQVCDTTYQGFEQSATPYSRIFFSYKDGLKGIIKDDGTVLYEPVFTGTGYITNTDGLLAPFTAYQGKYLYVKNNSNKMGVFDEKTASMVVPVLYDGIYQKFETANLAYFAVKKDNKHGVISSKDSVVIPFDYDSIDMSRANADAYNQPQLLVKKGNRYGAVSFAHTIMIPLAYRHLQKLSDDNFYKAKKDSHYVLLDGNNNIVNKGPFADIGVFEGNIALSFSNGHMKLINKSGALISEAIPMEPHFGYTTFEALKQALIHALNSTDDKDLEIFAYKAAPSRHLLYLIKRNILTGEDIGLVSPEGVRKKYFDDLLLFKKTKWLTGLYDKSKLAAVDDYSFSDEGLITTKRQETTDFGDPAFLEKFLKDAVRVNGYWISVYCMTPHFYDR